MWITLDFSELYAGAGIALLVAVLGTPLLWRLTRPLRRWPRSLATNLGCAGLAGLLALPVSMQTGMEETALFTLLGSAILQGLALPILPFFARQG
ncbi:hypothetical protein C8P66_12131 [Humitalea rosea]|uniref:Uncharacterized protein n=1 Tax=Humitalea rosea TaxID=990373 RepID=A0A2W7I3S9_9PROT|nr:hypothetical protein [Humitalea rosea]PZW41324.1 hypothetical protein C8P66_12131 [Humitalea rosea]